MHNVHNATGDLVPWCVSVTGLRCVKHIEFLFGVGTRGNPRHIVVDGVSITYGEGERIGETIHFTVYENFCIRCGLR